MKHLHCYFWNLQIGWGLNVGRGDSCLWGDFRNPRKMSSVKVLCLPLDTAFVVCEVVFLVDCLNFPLYNWEINYFCIIEQLNQILFTALRLSVKQLLHQNFPTRKWVRLICEGFRANSTIWLVLMLAQSKKRVTGLQPSALHTNTNTDISFRISLCRQSSQADLLQFKETFSVFVLMGKYYSIKLGYLPLHRISYKYRQKLSELERDLEIIYFSPLTFMVEKTQG